MLNALVMCDAATHIVMTALFNSLHLLKARVLVQTEFTVSAETTFNQNHDLPLTVTKVLLLPKPYRRRAVDMTSSLPDATVVYLLSVQVHKLYGSTYFCRHGHITRSTYRITLHIYLKVIFVPSILILFLRNQVVLNDARMANEKFHISLWLSRHHPGRSS